MAKAMGQYEKVLDVLKEANGDVVTLDVFQQKCEVAGVNMYRISTYMWEIKTKTKFGVIPVKNGRKVTGYKLITPTASDATVSNTATTATVTA